MLSCLATFHFPVGPHVVSRLCHVSLSSMAMCPFLVQPSAFVLLGHVSFPGSSTSLFLVCPRVIFVLAHALYLGSTTQHFPIGTRALEHRPCGLFLFIRVSVHDFYTCTFLVLLHVRFRMPCIRNLDIARVHIKCRRSYRSMTSYNN